MSEILRCTFNFDSNKYTSVGQKIKVTYENNR